MYQTRQSSIMYTGEDYKKFWSKVEKTDSCWNWIGRIEKKGYGGFKIHGKYLKAHRFSYEIRYGEIPLGRELDHLCRNRRCVNPNHLEAVTHQVNCSRGINPHKFKTHCPKGHDYVDGNTVIWRNKRFCRECNRIKCTKYYERMKLQVG